MSARSHGGYGGSQLELRLDLSASTATRAELLFTQQTSEIRAAMSEVRPSAGAVQTFATSQALASAGNFSVRYAIAGQVCAASVTLAVACEAGFDNVGDQCVKVETDSFCSSTMSVRSAKSGRQLASRKEAAVLSDDALVVSFERGANVSFQMLPLKDAYKDSAGASQSSITLSMAGKLAGVYSVLAMQNGKPCSVVDMLTLQCQPGYEPDGRGACAKANLCSQAALVVSRATSRDGYSKSELQIRLDLTSVGSEAARAELSLVPLASRIVTSMARSTAETFTTTQLLKQTGIFSLDYAIDGQLCPADNLTWTVECEPGYDSVGSRCSKRVVDTFCSSLLVGTAKRAESVDSRKQLGLDDDDELRLTFDGGSDVDLALLPLKDLYHAYATAAQRSLVVAMGDKLVGKYRVLATRNGQECTVIDELEVRCRAGYIASEGKCERKRACSALDRLWTDLRTGACKRRRWQSGRRSQSSRSS
jgi:hypothetical protein